MTMVLDPVAKPSNSPADVRRGVFASFYCDRRGRLSRPKLLATIFLSDAVLVSGSGLLALGWGRDGGTWSWSGVAICAAVTAAVLLALRQNWSYNVGNLRNAQQQIGKVLGALVPVMATGAASVYLLGAAWVDREWIINWFLAAFLLLAISRALVARATDALRANGRLVRRTVIVGGGADTDKLIESLKSHKDRSIEILGIFDDRAASRGSVQSQTYTRLGTFEDLDQFCRDEMVDLLVVTVPISAERRLLQILQKLWPMPVDVRLSALSYQIPLSPKAYTYIGGIPMFSVFERPLSDWDRVIKNVFDRTLGVCLLIAAAPIMAAVAVAVRLDSRGPILFTQKRYGFNNELIEIYKFRSMFVDDSDAAAAKLVTRDDPRVTRVGRIIRKASLDELPQLFNVLKGQLSLVGPRPHATKAKAATELYEDAVMGYFARHRVKPGITGWAQVNGWRGETDTREKLEKRVEHDMYYIDNWSVLLDLKILLATPVALFKTDTAY